ncbi:hypothetical protein GQ53DRAFT_713812, partial [Thozetella sp. PMI_491]
MSSALTNAARLKPEIRLEQAIAAFEVDLSPEQNALFCECRDRASKTPPGIGDVMRLTAEIDRQISRKFPIGPRFTSVLEALQGFAALGDKVIGFAQNMIASAVWLLVRTTLLAVVKVAANLEKLSTLLMVVGCSAPRYQSLSQLYPRSRTLQLHLSEYFIVLVGLCHHMLKLAKKSTLGQLVLSLSDSDMKKYQSELENWAGMIKDEASLLMGKSVEEQGNMLRFLTRSSSSELQRQKAKARTRVLQSCSTYNYQQTWKEIRKAGNATIFERKPQYQDWKTNQKPSTLVWSGKLGSGKSTLLANIVDDLNLHTHDSNDPVAYFFSRYDISESLQARTVIGSLARQLLGPDIDLTAVEQLVDETNLVVDSERIVTLLQKALPVSFRAYFVLDGLDECDKDQRETVIEQLQRLQSHLTLLICTSQRLEAGKASKVSTAKLAGHSNVDIPDDNPDIEEFISAELERCIESEKLTLGDFMLIGEIQDGLLAGAQGIFLWVALQIEALCAEKTDEAIRLALRDLPKDLPETFSRVLRRSSGLGKQYQKTILKTIAIAYRPLTTEELREALSVFPGDAEWNEARLISDIHSVLACCGSLVAVDEEQSTVRLVHHSVKQYLLGEFEGASDPMFTADSAHKTMAGIVVTYLSYSVFETQVSTTVVPEVRTRAVPTRVIGSTTPGVMRTLALNYLKRRKQPDFDVSKYVAEAQKLARQDSADRFHFYSYAKAYWLQHAWCISKDEIALYNLLIPLVDRGNIADAGTPLRDAASIGNVAAIQTLLDSGVDIESADSAGRTPLMNSALNGHAAIVETLLENGAEPEARDIHG